MKILFITWDGPQLSYLQSLFLPIFKALGHHGYQFHVLQFTWGDRRIINQNAFACESHGIPYSSVRVERWLGGPGAFLSAWFGASKVDDAVRTWRIDTLMPRSLMPAISVLRCRSLRSCKIVFDSDGLAADERVDFAGLDASSLTYRLLRDFEAEMLRKAQCVLVRTPAAADILWARAGSGTSRNKFFVVSNGKDTQKATEAPPQPDAIVRLCFIGSVGPQYEPERMLQIARGLKDGLRNLQFDVYTRDIDAFHKHLSAANLAHEDWIRVGSLEPEQVQSTLARYDAGFALRTRTLSTLGVAPIKIAEYLMAGVPIVGTPGVGDVEDLLRERTMVCAETGEVGPILDWLSGYVLPNRDRVRKQCRATAVRKFSLERSVTEYAEALNTLGGPACPDIPA